MKIDTFMAPSAPATIGARARELEALGFDCIWTFEATSDAFLPLAHAAAATTRIGIGTNIAVAFARSPFSMAQIAWDLQRDSGGRFRLGLGTQVRAHIERRFSMPFDHPAARVTDYIRCVRAIWDTFQHDTRPDYEGPFYRFNLINAFFNPGPIDHPAIPVYLAGVNPRMCRAAGEVADGFHVHPMHSAGYLRDVIRPALAEGARAAGRSLADLEVYAPVFIITGENQAETDALEQIVRRQIAFYATTPSYGAVLEYHGYPDLGRTLNGLLREGRTDALGAAIPEALLEHIAIIAPPGEIGQRIRARYDGLLQRVALYRSMGDDGEFSRWQELIAAVHA
jgi:probable F420-dependent oxidoreductase